VSKEPRSRQAEISRRDLLKATAAVGAGAFVAGMLDGDRLHAAPAPKLPLRQLGRTKLMVTSMAVGGIGLEDPAVLAHAFDVGFNSIHTCPGYVGGRSIRAVGEVMKTRRKGILLFLKDEPRAIDDDLKLLNTTWVECILPQTDSPEQAADPRRRADFEAAKKAGKIRFMGCAIHQNVPTILKAVVEQKYYDMALIVYNPASGNTAERTALDEAMAAARKQGMGIMAMKSVRGSNQSEQQASVKALLTDARVDVVLKTMRTHQDVENYLAITKAMAGLPRKIASTEIGEQLAGRVCVACGQCGKCPQGIPVADILRFRMYSEEYGWVDYGRRQYAALPADKLASNCTNCGECLQGCGNRLNIPKMLAEAHAILS